MIAAWQAMAAPRYDSLPFLQTVGAAMNIPVNDERGLRRTRRELGSDIFTQALNILARDLDGRAGLVAALDNDDRAQAALATDEATGGGGDDQPEEGGNDQPEGGGDDQPEEGGDEQEGGEPEEGDNTDGDIQIHVKRIDSNTVLTFSVEPSDTVRHVKGLIKNREGISKNFQRLTYLSDPLFEDMALVDCDIESGSMLELVPLPLASCYVAAPFTSRGPILGPILALHENIVRIYKL